MSRLSTLALAAVAALAVAAPAQAAGTVQPGGYMESDDSGCTLNFIYDGTGTHAGRTFVGTAAHCVSRVDEEIRDLDGDLIGHVAFIGDQRWIARDYAFIEVAAGRTVSPAVAGHPEYPTGLSEPAATSRGDRLQFSGYGIGFDLTQPTREERFGVLDDDDSSTWQGAGALMFGDSGGPIVHVPTGTALGIESSVCIGTCTDEGPTVDGAIRDAGRRGFTVAMRTVSGS